MAGADDGYDDVNLHLRVLDEDHEITARARVGKARVLTLLPLARTISEGVSKIAIAHETAAGRPVSCARGCSACCHHLIPIAPAEAVRLAEVVEAMPRERRREVTKRFEKAVRRMEQVGLVDPRRPRGQAALLSKETDPSAAWNDTSRRYFEANIACPLLENDACSVYAERPMICREYHVTTPAERCKTHGEGVRDVPRPVRMSEAMTTTTNEILGRSDLGVPIPLALTWAEAHRRAFHVEGDGEQMAMALIGALQSEDEE